MPFRSRLHRFRRVVRATVVPGDSEVGRAERALAAGVRLVIQMGREFVRDRCMRQAASLAFQTLLAFVPLAAVLLVLTEWVERLGDRSAIEELLRRFLLPGAARDLSVRIAAVVQRVDFSTIGWIGGLALVPLGGALFLQVEDVLNDIWAVPRGRPWWQRLLVLLGLTLVAVPVVAAAVYLSVERLQPPLDILVPGALALAGLTLIYKLMPHVRVRWRSALAGAVLATTLLGLARAGFGAYIDRFGWTYESVYGAIAFVPICLFWVYLAWLTFLLGVEVSYTSQNLRALWARAHEKGKLRRAGPDLVRALSWPHAVRLARELAAADEPLGPEALAVRLRLPFQAVSLLAGRLAAAGLASRNPEGRYRLARPPQAIPLSEVYDAVVDGLPSEEDLESLVAGQRAGLAGKMLAAEPPP